MFNVHALDIIRDYTGYYLVIIMSIWVYQRSQWIANTSGSMQTDARAVQCVAICMIFSIILWQVFWGDIGTTIETVGFVLLAIATRIWLSISAGMAVVSHWNLIEGTDSKRNFKRLGMISVLAGIVLLVVMVF